MKRVAILLVVCLVLFGCSNTLYICPDGSEVKDKANCPKKPKLSINIECRPTNSNSLGGGFPDLVTGEITLRAQNQAVKRVNIQYSLYGRSDNKVKFTDSKYIDQINLDSEKEIIFTYKPESMNELWTGETGYSGGVMGMNLILTAECQDCEVAGIMKKFCSS